MKRFVKILFFNIFSIAFVFIAADWYLNVKEAYTPYWLDTSHMERPDVDDYYNPNKKSIITIGCSFTHGMDLAENQTLAGKLRAASGRKVYNRGIPGHGPQHVLWQLQTSEFFNGENNIVEPEYFIYTFISDHIRRMYAHYFSIDDTYAYIFGVYDVKRDKLVPRVKDKIRLTDYFFITKLAKRFNYFMYKIKSDDEKFNLLKRYLSESKKELEKRYKDAKFVIVVYNADCDTTETHNSLPFRTERWKELEDDGFIVIRFDTPEFDFLHTEEYLYEDKIHPGEKAWETLTPIIVEKLNLRAESSSCASSAANECRTR